MQVIANHFKARLLAKQKQIGIWLSMASNVSAEVVAGSGYDWALIDMEHSPNDIAIVLAQLQVFAGYNTQALVRPAWNDPIIVKKLLDLGVQSFIFPMIQTVEEAQRAVASTRYPPNGIRGVAGVTRASGFGRVSDYPNNCESHISVIVQLETAAALSRADEIAGVDGVDAVFFGPADIAADLGMVGKPMASEVWDLINPVAERLNSNGVPIGTFVLDANMSAQLLRGHFNFVACGMDTSLLARAADALLKEVRTTIDG